MWFFLLASGASGVAVTVHAHAGVALGLNLNKLAVGNDVLFFRPEWPGQQAGAPFLSGELDVAVGAVPAGVQCRVLQDFLVLVVRNAVIGGGVPKAALGAVGLWKERRVRVVVQGARNGGRGRL
jgi:hypothetical protein